MKRPPALLERPGLGGVLAGLPVAESPFEGAHDLALAVAQEVGEDRRLVVQAVDYVVPLPVPLEALGAGGVDVEVDQLAGEAQDDDVRPSVARDVAHVGEEVLGIVLWVEGLGGVVLEPLLEVRPAEPQAARDDVHVPVLVQVRRVGPLAEELLRERRLLPSHGLGLGLLGPGGCKDGGDGGLRDCQRDNRDERVSTGHAGLPESVPSQR